MRSFLSSLLLAGALALAGCATNPLSPTPSGITLPTAQQVVDAAKATCAVVPNIIDVATLISTNPAIGTAAAFAKAICAAVTNLSARRGAPASVMVNGVRIRLGARLGARRGAASAVIVNGVTIHYTQ
jgi:hypothetical protein